MIKTEFFELLSSLSCNSGENSNVNEFREFMKMLDSPFFGAKSASINLVDFLYQNFYPLRRSFGRIKEPTSDDESRFQKQLLKAVSKKAAWEFIFPNEDYKESRMTVLLGKTKAHLEHFITYQTVFGSLRSRKSLIHAPQSNLGIDDRMRLDLDLQLLRHFLNRGEIDLFQKHLRKAWRLMEVRKNRDGAWHEYAFRLEELHNDFQNRHYGKSDHYNEMAGHFDHYFLLKKLRMYCAMLNRSHLLGTVYDYPMLQGIIEFSHSYAGNPLIGIYVRIYQILQGSFTQEAYSELWNLIRLHKATISKTQLKQFAMYCRNSLQFEKIKGSEDYEFLNQSAFEITLFMDEEQIIGVDTKISDAQFVFAIKTSLAVRALSWTREFIDRESENVVGSNTTAAIIYAECYLEHLKVNHLPALKALESAKFSSRYLMIQQRCLRLKLLFHLLELDDPYYADTKPILDACDALAKVILAEETFSSGRKARFRNFVGIVKRLVRLKTGGAHSKKDLDTLAERIFREPIEDKEWIMHNFLALEGGK